MGGANHAPGRCSEVDALAAAHHVLLSHGRAVEVLRRVVPKAQVGITLNLDHLWPASDTDADRSAAHWLDGHHNRSFSAPLFHGAYPQDMVDQWHKIMPPVQDGDMESIAVPIDFLGVNVLSPRAGLVAAGLDGEGARQVPQAGTARTDMDWEDSGRTACGRYWY